MASNRVIVFGPTGSVGSYVATSAEEHGASVTLAMRDTSKSIPCLSKEDEAAGNYTRVQADLTKPETVTAAVKKSGAKSAFIYLMQTSQDGMKAIIQALEDAGITFIVFLSSFTIRGNPEEIPPEDLIPFIHARVELSLEEVYGSANYVALRPGGFATNVLHWKKDLEQGNVRLYCPKAEFDYITPEDMGQVGGVILARGKQVDGEKDVYLFGPNMTAQEDAVKTISMVTGRDISVEEIDQKAGQEVYEKTGMPPPFAAYLAEKMKEVDEQSLSVADPELFKQGVANIERYLGRPAIGFEEWVKKNTHFFKA